MGERLVNQRDVFPQGQHVYQGDYFAQGQLGGNAGGRDNHNAIITGRADDLAQTIQKIEVQFDANGFKDNEYWGAIGEIKTAREKCEELLQRCKDIESKLLEKGWRGLTEYDGD